VKLTAVKDRFVVSVNGVDVSSHFMEREAIQSAVGRVVPGNDVRYRHDYVVVVQTGVTKTAALLGGQIMVNGE
jgi:hypothetical protein